MYLAWKEASRVMKKGSKIEKVIFCLYDEETYRIFEEELERIKAESD